ncbi:hypothetical protein NLJ89_g2389 [Agrocybe chaxingu]|uniref:BTB domain-containing protein n=1 Tax=Agrocybe chaxingu TaxID=84603 RepID=A0A9W8KB59_9AGAR|nr:hypothetical protein NLJ89_g2389 [Agrocybe chaxingu]
MHDIFSTPSPTRSYQSSGAYSFISILEATVVEAIVWVLGSIRFGTKGISTSGLEPIDDEGEWLSPRPTPKLFATPNASASRVIPSTPPPSSRRRVRRTTTFGSSQLPGGERSKNDLLPGFPGMIPYDEKLRKCLLKGIDMPPMDGGPLTDAEIYEMFKQPVKKCTVEYITDSEDEFDAPSPVGAGVPPASPKPMEKTSPSKEQENIAKEYPGTTMENAKYHTDEYRISKPTPQLSTIEDFETLLVKTGVIPPLPSMAPVSMEDMEEILEQIRNPSPYGLKKPIRLDGPITPTKKRRYDAYGRIDIRSSIGIKSASTPQEESTPKTPSRRHSRGSMHSPSPRISGCSKTTPMWHMPTTPGRANYAPRLTSPSLIRTPFPTPTHDGATSNRTPSMNLIHSPGSSPGKRRLSNEGYSDMDEAAKKKATFERHETQWYAFGDVYLQVGKVRFRIPKGPFSRSSEWFKALFASSRVVGQEKGAAEQSAAAKLDGFQRRVLNKVLETVEEEDGMTLYHLDHIKQIDTDALAEYIHLQARYFGLPYDSTSTKDCKVLANTMKMADFVADQVTFEMVKKELTKLFSNRWQEVPETKVANAEYALHIARAYNIPEMIPRAFYELARDEDALPHDTYRTTAILDHRNWVEELPIAPKEDVIRIPSILLHLTNEWQAIADALVKEKICNAKSGGCGKVHMTWFEAPNFPTKRALESGPVAASKRKHEEVEDDGIPADGQVGKVQRTYVKHEDHWALDGNLLLQIDDVRFKVHRSRLASESEWFQVLIDCAEGRLPEEDYEHLNQINAVVATREDVNGVDLFFLDVLAPPRPDARAFAALLTAMVRAMFCYYNLAKSRPFPLAAEQMTEDDTIRKKALEELPVHDLFRLLDIAKRLSLAWDAIVPITEHKCTRPRPSLSQVCNDQHKAASAVTRARKNHPFDPIAGILHLQCLDWRAHGYCEKATKAVHDNLSAKRDAIWEELKTWIEVS